MQPTKGFILHGDVAAVGRVNVQGHTHSGLRPIYAVRIGNRAPV
jgi:hypothetical protein